MTIIRILSQRLLSGSVLSGGGPVVLPRGPAEAAFGGVDLLSFLTGAALVSTLMFALASGRLVYTKLLVVIGLATIGAWLWLCRPKLRRDPDEEPLSAVCIPFLVPLAVYGCLYLFAAMLPETSADGAVYHLGLISRYYDHRGFMPFPHVCTRDFPKASRCCSGSVSHWGDIRPRRWFICCSSFRCRSACWRLRAG